MMIKFCSLVSTLLLSASLFAASTTEQASAPAGKNTAMEAAMQACAASAGKDASGGPDRTAMDTCMQAKGFTRPTGAPPAR